MSSPPDSIENRAVQIERENLRRLFSEVPEVVCFMSGPDHRFEFVNETHKHLLGFDATGQTVREAQPESVEAHVLLDQVYQTGKKLQFDSLAITVGETLRYFNFTYSPRFGSDGQIDGIMALASDVTDASLRASGFEIQKKALEMALTGASIREVADLLVHMVERQVSGGLIGSLLLADPTSTYLYHGAAPGLPDSYNEIVNGIAIGMNVGSCGTAAFTKQITIVDDIATDPRWADYVEIALEHGLRSCWSVPILSTRGKVLGTFALYSRKPQFPTDGEMHLAQIAASTTALILERQFESDARIAQSHALQESETRLSLALHAGNIGLWDWNAKTGYVYLSDTLMKDWGIDPEMFGHTLPECMALIHAEDRDRTWEEIQRSTFEKRAYDVDYRVLRPDGALLWVNAKGRFYLDANGQPERLTGISINITERRRIAHELERAKIDAERANHLKSAFLANMSHEIRTPLGAMMGFAQLLGEPGATMAEQANYIDILRKNGEQLGTVINDILDLSKVETGHINFEYLKVNPLQIAHEVVSLMAVVAKDKGLVLSLEDDGTVPESVVTDPTRTKQVLMNLVSNALKFTKVGTIKIMLSGYEGPAGEKCCAFEVSDTGIGIPDDAVDRLFKMFTQADNSMTRKFGGTGLGLALSRSLARAMGGNVRLVRSQLNNGSTFHFSIESREDLLLGADLETAELKRTLDEALPDNALQGMRVLLVEDSPDNQELIWRYLSRYGAQIEIADNGSEGVTKALSGEHDIVLMDLQMPVMDGYTAVGKLRSRGYQTPIIALTAHAMSDVRKKCQDVGCTDHLPKPINSRELVSTVSRYALRSTGARTSGT